MKKTVFKFKQRNSWSVAMRVGVLATAALGGSQLFATPITGNVSIDGSVGVSGSAIDFQLPVGPPNGAFTVGANPAANTGSFSGLSNTTGTILDLNVASQPPGTPFLLPSFLTFSAAPNIRFDLTMIAPGV